MTMDGITYLADVEFKYTGGARGWKGDVPRFQLDANKIKKLGWAEKRSSDEAVKKSIRETLDNEWYKFGEK